MRDARDQADIKVLYARIPSSSKLRLDLAARILEIPAAVLLAALIDEHVDPQDPRALDRLARLAKAAS